MSQTAQLFLITGFLGSGKTSVINSLLSKLTDKRVGLILNDFGPIAVDSALIGDKEKIIITESLHGGQIFCSCLSGSFIARISEMAGYDLDYIIVEASGLAKPSTLMDIISHITSVNSGNKIVYRGMICVIDALRYGILSQSVAAIREQIVFSDWFIVNKSDLVDDKALQSTVTTLKELKPGSDIFCTSFGQFTSEMRKRFDTNTTEPLLSDTDAQEYKGWGSEGRPESFVFLPEEPVSCDEIRDLFESVAPSLMRAKGFLLCDDEMIRVDIVGEQLKVDVVDRKDDLELGIVCIHTPSVDALSLVKEKWNEKGYDGKYCIRK